MKGKALRRALASDPLRVGADIPLIRDTTELVTPEMARDILTRNHCNRPVNWRKVEEFKQIMLRGEWRLHSQGIILDTQDNLLTGQTRLWAVIYSNMNIYMRISRGNSPDTAKIIDRGRPQSARDLATRDTQRRHSPLEASLAKAICGLHAELRPSTDRLGETIAQNASKAAAVLSKTTGMKKTKALLMILAAICFTYDDIKIIEHEALRASIYVGKLELALLPNIADKCWGKGAAFSLALEHARKCITQDAV